MSGLRHTSEISFLGCLPCSGARKTAAVHTHMMPHTCVVRWKSPTSRSDPHSLIGPARRLAPPARSDRTHAKIMSAATQVGQSATTSSLKSSSADADDVRLGSVNTEQNVATWSTRRATLPAEGDTWQPGDGYHGQANLEAKLDAAFADGSEASHVPASCSSRRGNECLGGSRASLVAANAPLVGKYSPPALRTSLHR